MEQIAATAPSISSEVELFRLGRLGMGWSQEALAQTVLVSLETVQRWEDGEVPIPAKVMAWVGLYARCYPIPPSGMGH